MNAAPQASPRRRRSIDDQLIPLINVVFLLLIFFMVAGQIAPLQEAAVEPPASESRKAAPREPALLVLERGGVLRIDGRRVAATTLAGELGAHADRTAITLAADRAVLAADLVPVLGALRDAGFASVTLYARRGEQR